MIPETLQGPKNFKEVDTSIKHNELVKHYDSVIDHNKLIMKGPLNQEQIRQIEELRRKKANYNKTIAVDAKDHIKEVSEKCKSVGIKTKTKSVEEKISARLNSPEFEGDHLIIYESVLRKRSHSNDCSLIPDYNLLREDKGNLEEIVVRSNKEYNFLFENAGRLAEIRPEASALIDFATEGKNTATIISEDKTFSFVEAVINRINGDKELKEAKKPNIRAIEEGEKKDLKDVNSSALATVILDESLNHPDQNLIYVGGHSDVEKDVLKSSSVISVIIARSLSPLGNELNSGKYKKILAKEYRKPNEIISLLKEQPNGNGKNKIPLPVTPRKI